jgi:hypothetical protein
LSYYSASLSSSPLPLSSPLSHDDGGSAHVVADVASHKPVTSSILTKEKDKEKVKMLGSEEAVDIAVKHADKLVQEQVKEKEKEKGSRKNTRDSSTPPAPITTTTAAAAAAAAEELLSLNRVIPITPPITPLDIGVTSVAEFERTGLRNRDGDRDRDAAKQSIAIGPVEFIKSSRSNSPTALEVTNKDTNKDTGMVSKNMCSYFWMCTFRLLSSSLANSTYREAQEKDRDRCREGAGHATTPSVLSMAGE